MMVNMIRVDPWNEYDQQSDTSAEKPTAILGCTSRNNTFKIHDNLSALFGINEAIVEAHCTLCRSHFKKDLGQLKTEQSD